MAAAVKTKSANFVAFDLGADSGRAVVGQFDGDRLALTELHRFPNGPTKVLGHLHWDVLRLFAEMKTALGLYVKQYGKELAGIGVDTWGVDFALLDAQGDLLRQPVPLPRHPHRGDVSGSFQARARAMRFSSDRHPVHGDQHALPTALHDAGASRHCWTSGQAADDARPAQLLVHRRKVCEFTDATTTQFYDPREKELVKALFQKLGLPKHILAEIIQPGTVLGPLHASVAEEVGLGAVPVIAPACHDTGSAVAAVPAVGREFRLYQLRHLVADGHRGYGANDHAAEPRL